jgi:hypothetical protein
MFKKITRTKAIPAKRHPFILTRTRTRVHRVRISALCLGAAGADNMYPFLFNIKGNNQLRAKLGNVDNAACRESAARLIACHEGPRFWMAPQHMVGSLARPYFSYSDYHRPAYWPCHAVQRHDALAKCSRAAKHYPKQPKQHHCRRLASP